MSNNQNRKQLQGESPYPPYATTPTMSIQGTPHLRTRSQQITQQHSSVASPRPATSSIHAADEFSKRDRSDEEQQASFADQRARSNSYHGLIPFSAHFSPPQNFSSTASDPSACGYIGSAFEPLGYPTHASITDASAGAHVVHSPNQRNEMQHPLDFRVPSLSLQNGYASPGQSLQSSNADGDARVPGSPMIAPQPRRGVPQQLLEGQNIPVVPQPQGLPAQPPRLPPATRLPPLNLARRRLIDSAAAHAYFEHPYWRPLPRSHGVPQTEEDRLPYVKKIYDALVDTDNVFDSGIFPNDKNRFDAVHGVWGTKPACIEAVAHRVVETCMTLHDKGATGLALGHFPALRRLNQADKVFTFAQRIHFMSLLLRHFKFHANHVMDSNLTMQYLARIWSTLWELPGFQMRWNHLNPVLQNQWLHKDPYQNVPAKAMTHDEGMQYQREEALEQEQRRMQVLQYQQHVKQRRISLQAQKQTQNRSALKRPIDAVQSPAADVATKRRNVETLGEPSAPAQQQPDTAAQEISANGEDVDLATSTIKNDEGQTGWETLFSNHSASLRGAANAQIDIEDALDVGVNRDFGEHDLFRERSQSRFSEQEVEDKTEESSRWI